MLEHALALVIVVPLLAAPLCVLVGRGGPANLVSCGAAWTAFALALHLVRQVLASGPVVYAVGGWDAPVGIELRLDAAGALVLVVVTGIASLIAPYAWRSVASEVDPHKRHWFHACFLLCVTGLSGMAATGDAFNVFVFLEISSLSTYVLVAIGRKRQALTAAFRYLLIGTIGATFYLIGIGFLFMLTGTLTMSDMAQRLVEPAWNGNGLVHETTTARAAFAFLTVGLSLKIAIWPLHLWLPAVYTHAPSAVSAFLSATATKVAVLVLLHVFYTIDGLTAPFESLPIADTLVPLAVVGTLSASFAALYQSDVKRALALSSVAQVGYIVVGIGLASADGLVAALLHLFNHALMKGALFCALGCLVLRVGSATFAELRGAGRSMPLTAAALLVGGASLIGVPLTAGFVSKWALVTALFEQERWWTAIAVVASSLLAIGYVGRIVHTLLIAPRPAGAAPLREAPLTMLVPTLLLAFLNLWFGLFGGDVRLLAERAAAMLMGGAA